MKRFLLISLIIFSLSALLLWFMPYWWLIIVVSFIVSAFAVNNGYHAFFAGFLAIGLLWLSLNIWRVSTVNEEYVESISSLLMIPGGSAVLILVSTLLGALMGALGALTGTLLVQLFTTKKR